MSWRKQGTGIGVVAVLAASFVLGAGLPASAAMAEGEAPPGMTAETLASSTFEDIFPGGNPSQLDPTAIFGEEVMSRVSPGSTYEQIANAYTLSELFGGADIQDLADRLAPAADQGSRHKRVAWFCGGVFECGFKFSNNESKVVANAVLAGGGAGGQVACSMIPNPIIQAACRPVAAAVAAGAIAVANIVLSNPSRCLLYRPNLAPLGSPWAVVTC